ncbi:intermembrane lipid transfer protein VPS13A isoform X1 [Hydra vulgaris]|uniref:intermembrane lipid transfer protein VPS13A isoform X1 n=1 Tax=Hydra vulgaris TaxID=6087 RepID=UPI0032E9DAF8
MVFESIVADLLNKYLGQYVKNLDASQLKIGIWGGNVVLENLELKDTALDDLDLPIKVVRGYLGMLVLAIPWKNLYHEATIVEINDLHIVSKPNFDIKYNKEKEEKDEFERKKRQIENIEEARRVEEEKKKAKSEQKEDQDSFVEKLATNIIKNLQVTIKNIHIRYEDSTSDPTAPFAVGVTLGSLTALTTDDNFVPQVIKESLTIINKLLKLDYLALYWNSKENSHLDEKEKWLEFSRSQISTSQTQPKAIKYILQPIIASKKLKINTKPGLDMNIPKIFFSLIMEELGIVLFRSQYHGLMKLLESFERMNRNIPFRKYRPFISLKENVRAWWIYCITSVLKEDVNRRFKMWSWQHISTYRKLCKLYKKKYQEKLEQKNPSKSLLADLEKMEKDLNIVSITIFRQLAENEFLRSKKTKEEKSSFLSIFKSKKKDTNEKKASSKLEELLGVDKDAEMAKLYEAIGYSENEVITAFPSNYVAMVFDFQLKSISIALIDDSDKRDIEVIRFFLNGIHCNVKQRPSANALRVEVQMQSLKLNGTPNSNDVPLIIRSISKKLDTDMVVMTFETNPMDNQNIDQSLTLDCEPLEIIYDANSINKAFSFFEPPQDVILQDLQNKAYSTFEEFKVSSTAGILHAIEVRNILDISINIDASYLIIPEKGTYTGCKDMAIIDFGSFHLRSDPCQIRNLNVKDIDNISEVQEKAYDRFYLKLKDLQLLLCKEGENFQIARQDSSSKLHVLYPVSFEGSIAKSIIPNDPRLKQMSICGELSSLELAVSDNKISRTVKLLDSLPKIIKADDPLTDIKPAQPYSKQTLSVPSETLVGIPISPSIQNEDDDSSQFHTPPECSVLSLNDVGSEPQFSSGIANQIKIELNFVVQKIKFSISLTDKITQNEEECVEMYIHNISAEVLLRRWDMFVNATVGQFVLKEMKWGKKGKPLELFYTPDNANMLKLSYRRCEFDQSLTLGPSYFYSQEAQLRALQFRDEFQSTQQIIDVRIAMFYVIIHQEALLSLTTLLTQILEPLQLADQSVPTNTLKKSLSSTGSTFNLFIEESLKSKVAVNKEAAAAKEELKNKVGMQEEIKMKVTAYMDGLDVLVCSSKVDLAHLTMKGFSANVLMQDSKIEVKANMSDLLVEDKVGETNFSKILSMQSDQVFDIEVVVFNDATIGTNLYNMSAVDLLIKLDVGQIRAVFLNRFVMDVYSFLDNFESAKVAILEAGAAAKEKATIAVSQLQKHSSRNQMIIKIKAPLIIVPVHSLSELALVIDLGMLSIYNNFRLINKEKRPKDYVIVDNMIIKLSELKLSKALIKGGINVVAHRALIEPMSLKLNLARSLTNGNHSIPDIELQGSLQTITIVVSEEDISVAFKIIQGNIAEGQLNDQFKETEQDDSILNSTKGKQGTHDRMADINEEPENVIVYEKTIFKFDLEKVILQLYLKPPDMTFEEEFLERDIALMLSQFTIGHFGVTGKILSDNSMSIFFVLETLQLYDKRPSSINSLTCMMDYCQDYLVGHTDARVNQIISQEKFMVEANYQQSSQGDINMNVTLNNLMTILNVEFLMVVMQTILAIIPKADTEYVKTTESHTHSITSIDEDNVSLMSDATESIHGTSANNYEMRFQLKVNNPQVVLLADARNLKTNALFFTTAVFFQYLQLQNAQKMIASISNTEVFSTAFKKEYRSDTSKVLYLDTINFHSSTNLESKPQMSIYTSVIKLNVSPKTIHTLSACLSQTVMPENIEITREKQKTMSKLWEINDVSGKKLWYLNTPPQHILSAGSFVFARMDNGSYLNGFLANKDTHYLVYFYPEGSIKHSVADNTSVVLDMIPKESELLIGVNVLALHSHEKGWQTARIVAIWNGEPEVAEELIEDNFEEFSPTHEKNTINKYLIRFYYDCIEKYHVAEELRVLPFVNKAGSPGLGACVYARYKDGFYYKGFVKRIKDNRWYVSLYEINEDVDHDIDDPSAVILNINPQEYQVKKLFKVIASKSESVKGYHPGKVAAIKGNRGCLSYLIHFDDDTTNHVPLTKLLLLPKAPFDALPTPGTYVYSLVARDKPVYEKGIVAELDDKMIYIHHLSKLKIAHDRHNTEFVVRNIVPLSSSLRIGQDVIAQKDSSDLCMHLAKVTDIVESSNTKHFYVKFTDGSIKKVNLGKIRIVPKIGMSDSEEKQTSDTSSIKTEHLLIDVEGICLRIEGYLGGQLTPMMRFDLKLQADVFDWTGKVSGMSTLSMQASYYNESVAEWEPLIEPIAENRKEKPWQLSIEYITQKDNIQDETALLIKPMAVLKAVSYDCLEMTLTKSSISLLQDLGKLFSDAYECSEDVPKPVSLAKDPFIIQNKTGKKVTVELNDCLQTSSGERHIVLENSTSVGFEEVKIRKSGEKRIKRPLISIQVDGFQLIKNIVIKQQRIVIYDLVPDDNSGSEAYSVLIEVTTNDGQRSIYIRSPLQIKNHFPMPIDILYKNKDSENKLLAKVESKCTYAVPLIPAYHCSFYLKPSGFIYTHTTIPIVWNDFAVEKKKLLSCINSEDESFPFYIQIVAEEEVYASMHGKLNAIPKYLINCYPSFTLHNYLPYTIKYKTPGMTQMECLNGGSSWPLFTVSTDQRTVISVEIWDYFLKTWHGDFIASGITENSKTATFILISDDNKPENNEKLELKIYTVIDGGIHITLYSPYWMLNKTGKTLIYQAIGNDATFVHPTGKEEALMFNVKKKSSKKARICVENCEWSDVFSLDTVNSGGALKSEGLRKRMFEIGVGISLSYFSLTKIVTFTPLRVLTNHTKYSISMAESGSETSEWHTVKPDESIPYWPTCLPPKNLFLNINGFSSVNFDPLPGQTLLLKFQNEIGGICVNYQEKDSTSLISFKPYFSGSAPVRVENLCKKISMISYKQTGYFKGHVLLYGQSVLYTWDDPTLSHELTCGLIEVADSLTKITLDKNDFGRIKAPVGGAIYWVTFLDGLQRVLLFTDNFKSAYCANQEQILRATQEIDINLEGIGLSLVNSEKRLEIGYLSIKKSNVIWEKKKNSRWKSMTHQMCEALEEGYQRFQNKGSKREKILEVEVDFEKMFITKPDKIKIRRTFHSGFGFKYIISPNRMQVSATLSSLQFDSHIPGSTFMTILHVVEPPKSVASDSAPKPFFELSLTASIGEENEVHQISYLKVLIQEMDVRVDKGLLLSVMDLLSNDKIRGSEIMRYNYDMSIVLQKLEDSPEFQAAKKDKRYVFDFFHLSPLKIHVSFSMTGGHSIEGSDSTIAHGHVLNLLLQSVGVAFTEIQDVEFKLACFEVNSMLLSSSQLTSEIMKHYQSQAINQLYVLVLGLDVLGNPYGLITGVGAGAKNFFYEPYQGLIQGPEEFAEGLAYGVKSLVGGTVGGVSGAVSKITGTVGKGLAALTMDDEYQQKRRQRMSQKPTNLGQGLVEGGKGLVKGIFSGVTGIVVKPYEGAKAEGATGFIKGIGKGLVGVVARPVGGVVDMASSTFDGLKSTTSGVKRISHNRVPRVFHADKVLRAFNEYEAEGNQILMEADKGRYAKNEYYMVHIYLADLKSYLILTNTSILLVNRNEILHEWESSWKLGFSEIKDDPVIDGNKITFNLNSPVHRKSVFKKTVNSRVVTLQTDAVAKWFVSKFEDAKIL